MIDCEVTRDVKPRNPPSVSSGSSWKREEGPRRAEIIFNFEDDVQDVEMAEAQAQ